MACAKKESVIVSPRWSILLTKLGVTCSDVACQACYTPLSSGDEVFSMWPYSPEWLARILGALDKNQDITRVNTWFYAFGSLKPGDNELAPGFRILKALLEASPEKRSTILAYASVVHSLREGSDLAWYLNQLESVLK